MTLSLPPRPNYSSIPYVQHHKYPTPSFSEIQNKTNASTYSQNVGKYISKRLTTIPKIVPTSRLFYFDPTEAPLYTAPNATIPARELVKGFIQTSGATTSITIDSSQELVDAIFERYSSCESLANGFSFPVVVSSQRAAGGGPVQLLGTAATNNPLRVGTGGGNDSLNAGTSPNPLFNTIWVTVLSVSPPKVAVSILNKPAL